MSLSPFLKPALPVHKQVQKLATHGLQVNSRYKASLLLQRSGYYRVKHYLLGLKHLTAATAISQCMLQDVIDFDSILRANTLLEIEKIETTLRRNINEYFLRSVQSPFWYLNPNLFYDRSKHQIFLEKSTNEVKRSKTPFIKKFNTNYCQPALPLGYISCFPDLPPSWMLFEVCSLGTLSRLYANLKLAHSTAIAKKYSIDYRTLRSWLEAITVTRNAVAHHEILWNKTLHTIRIPQNFLGLTNTCFDNAVQPNRYAGHLACMHFMLKRLRMGGCPRTIQHIRQSQLMYWQALGFSSSWRSMSFWRAKVTL